MLLLACQKDADLMDITARPKQPNSSRLVIKLTHLFGVDTLQLNRSYSDSVNGNITISVCKYYLTNIVLIDSNNQEILLPETYFLVDESLPISKIIRLNIPEGTYKSIRYMVGVDSARNVSGVQSGALDPSLGMFWTWVSGYIQAKLEGTYADFSESGEFIHHIGGFSGPYNPLQTIELSFSNPTRVATSKQLTLDIGANYQKWIRSQHSIVLKTTPVIMETTPESRKIAENYGGMFSLTSVGVE
jgi:hypothetical protein